MDIKPASQGSKGGCPPEADCCLGHHPTPSSREGRWLTTLNGSCWSIMKQPSSTSNQQSRCLDSRWSVFFWISPAMGPTLCCLQTCQCHRRGEGDTWIRGSEGLSPTGTSTGSRGVHTGVQGSTYLVQPLGHGFWCFFLAIRLIIARCYSVIIGLKASEAWAGEGQTYWPVSFLVIRANPFYSDHPLAGVSQSGYRGHSLFFSAK
jgi:hypothetical protein